MRVVSPIAILLVFWAALSPGYVIVVPIVTMIVVRCVANDTLVVTKDNHAIPVGLVVPGDQIRGVRGSSMEPAWCTVLANPDHGYGRVVGNFTAGHMVARKAQTSNGNITIVHNPDDPAAARMTGLRNIATDCELTETADGQLFSPFSDKFCDRELSWTEYLTLFSSVQTLTKEVPFVWDVRNWRDNESHPLYDTLHKLCNDLIECTDDTVGSASCSNLDTTVTTLIESNLDPNHQEVFRTVWQNNTAMIEAIHLKTNHLESTVITLSILSCAAVAFAISLCGIVAYLVVKMRRMGKDLKGAIHQAEQTAAAVKSLKCNGTYVV